MNWTGGRLSRHSRNANGSVTQRQKQHFAKARSNLLNGPQKWSPTRWSIFDIDDGATRGEDLMLYSAPRPARHSQPDFGPNDKWKSKKRPQSETSLKHAFAQTTFPGDKTSGLRRKSYRGFLAHGGSDHDFYQEVLSPSYTKVGKQQAPAMETAGDLNIDDEAESLVERRRRILRRIDWVGANIQHPIKLRFAVTENDERLGKRRRITSLHQNQFGAVAQPIITSSFAMPRPKQKPHVSLDAQSANGKNTESLSRNHVRISIGGGHVAARVASSTTHSKTVGGRFASSQASTSDEMLLDGDDISRRHMQLPQERQVYISYPASPPLAPSTVVGNASALSASHRDLPIRAPHCKQVLSSYSGLNGAIDRHNTASCADLEWRVPTSRTGENSPILDVAQRWDERINNSGNPSDQQVGFVTKPPSNLANLRSHSVKNLPNTTSRIYADITQISDQRTNPELFSPNIRYVTGVSRQLSESARRLQSVARDKSRRNARLNSQPELLHPIPLTSRTSRVLCSTSSEAGSTVPQINTEPVATRSQILDEEVWKTWVLSSQEDLSNESDSGVYHDVSISPGISNYGHWYVQRKSRNAIEKDTKDMGTSQGASGPHYASDQELEQPRVGSPTDIEKEKLHVEILPRLQEQVYHQDYPPNKPVIDYKSLFLSRARKLPSPPKPKPVRVANPDEAWMKFILSDDHDDDNDEVGSLHTFLPHQVGSAAVIQRCPSSSMIGHISAKSASTSPLELPISNVTRPNTKPNDITFNTANFLTEGPQTSNHTTQGSATSSSDGLAHQPSSVDLIRTQPVSSFSTPSRPVRKLTFTKPPRFQVPNRDSSPETTAATAGSPVHIGKGFSLAKLRDRGAGKRRDSGKARRERRRERDIYSLESEGDVESIEDD
jgi:hypothetical protein